MPAAHDHHLRMLDMAAFLNQGQSSDTSLILDQYGNGFGAAGPGTMLFTSQYGGPSSGGHGPVPARMDHHLHQPTSLGFMNGMMKLETMEGGAAGEQSAVTNVTSVSGEASGYSSSGEREMTNNGADGGSTALTNGAMGLYNNGLTIKVKTKRKLPGMPDPDAEVVALSPKTLLATNRFVCEICNKGFQRDQNLQLHRRGHNLPWKLKQRGNKEVRKKVYVCPEASCVHHDPVRALGDLTGIKKHFSRKHGEKKWKCDKCSKRYAVQSDWKAHSKTCGTREYRCDCGTLFSRRDSFITHRAFCDALAEESALRVQNQITGDHHLPSALSTAMAAQLAAQAGAGGATPFGSMIGAGLLKTQHPGLLDISPFDNSAGGRSGRLPLWLTSAAGGAGGNISDHHHQLLGNPNSHIMNPNAGVLNSYQGNAGSGSTSLFGTSALQSVPSVGGGLSQMAAAGNGMLYGDFENLDSTNGGFAGLSSLAALSSTMNHGAPLYNSTGHGHLLNATGNMAAQSAAAPPSLLSATSLLQKAAQMGSVSSSANPNSLFKVGLGTSMAPVSSTDALYWPQTSASKSLQGVTSLTRQYSDGMINGNNMTSDTLRPLIPSGFVNNSDHIISSANIQEMVASFNRGGAAATSFFMGGNTSDTTLSSKLGAVPTLPIMSSTDHQSPTGVPSRSQPSDHPLHHDMTLSAPNPTSLMALMPTHIKMEDGSSGRPAAADNFTRDFLGVRGDNINGVLAHEAMDKSLSQRDHQHATHDYQSNSKDNLSSEDENNVCGGPFHVKPWDQNQL